MPLPDRMSPEWPPRSPGAKLEADPRDLLDAIVEAIPDALFLLSSSGVIVKANRAAAELVDETPETMLGRSVERALSRHLEAHIVRDLVAGQRPATRVATLPHGRVLLLSARPLSTTRTNPTGLLLSIRDVSGLSDLVSRVHGTLVPSRPAWAEMRGRVGTGEIPAVVVKSHRMRALLEQATQYAHVDSPMLVLGETGTGKGLFARLIHETSTRRRGPFREINCGAIPGPLMEAELFGYTKGAFTGADARGKPGLVELAHRGTLLLDEIGDLPLPLQVKLLRYLESGEVWPLGASKGRCPDVRIVAATNCDLKQKTTDGTFRHDLFYRLNVLVLQLPPLREHPDDIPALIELMLERLERRLGVRKAMHPDAVETLCRYHFPGNVRELWNIVERVVVTAKGTSIAVSDLPCDLTDSVETLARRAGLAISLRQHLKSVEAQILREALQRYGTQALAAKHLGVTQPTIARKTKEYRLAD